MSTTAPAIAPSTSAAPAPLPELRAHLAAFVTRCRAAGWLGALFHARVAGDIAADIAAQHRDLASQAEQAGREDLAAADILEAASRDGLDRTDTPAVRRAIRLIRASAKRDHRIAGMVRA